MPRYFLLTFLSVSALFACNRAPASTQLKELAEDPSAENAALLFGGAAMGTKVQLNGVKPDLQNMLTRFSEPQLYFSAQAEEGLTASQILDRTKYTASNLDAGATLLWYYSGHGNDDGALAPEGAVTTNGSFVPAYQLNAKQLLDTLKAARSGKGPLARIIIVLDTCHSGQWIGGQQSDLFSDAVKSGSNAGIAKEIIAVSSARAFEEASDLGVDGGAMTASLIKAFSTLSGSSVATISTLLETMESNLHQILNEQDRTDQTPIWAAWPTQAILNSPLWSPGTTATNSSAPSSTHVSPKHFCGMSGGVSARILDCAYRKAPVIGRTWSLVSLGSSGGQALWRDDSTGLIWADKVPVKMAYNAARSYCDAANGPEFGGLGAQYPFRLPTTAEYGAAIDDGLAVLASDFKVNQEWWTFNGPSAGSAYSYNGYTDQFTPGPITDVLMTNCVL